MIRRTNAATNTALITAVDADMPVPNEDRYPETFPRALRELNHCLKFASKLLPLVL
jgi:hypothetical protein